ncbi:mannose-6-phosphatase [Hysterangium stoloniferum]|nr:mannose-6-phosphatase [Hysterangium stoloniferum]
MLASCLGQVSIAAAQTFRGMTWNLRWDSMADNVTIAQSMAALNGTSIETPASYYPDTNERPWSQRRIPVASQVVFEGVSLLGFEEAVVRQVDDLQTLLGSEWDHRGVGASITASPLATYPGLVFWKKDLLQLLTWDTFWLSETPFDVGSKAPKAGNPRICTTARFQAQTGILTVMVTHWDDQSDEAREIGASLILHRAKYEAATTQRVSYNQGVEPTHIKQNLISILAPPPTVINATFQEKFPVPAQSPPFQMLDLRTVSPKEHISGNFATYTGFDPLSDTDDMKRIDFIMGGSNGGWTANSYKVGTNIYDDGLYLSDHRPVFSDITLESGEFPL